MQSSSSSTPAIAVEVSVAVAVVLVVLLWFCWRKRRSHGALLTPAATGLWNDPVITAAQLPRSKMEVQSMLSCGAYGEVHRGIFDSEPVVVKMLLPAH